MSHDTKYNRRFSVAGRSANASWQPIDSVISPVPPAKPWRYDQSWGADVRRGNGGGSLGVELCPGEGEVWFFHQMERSEETDNSVITSAVIRGTGRGLPIRICGRLGDSALLWRSGKTLRLNTVSSFWNAVRLFLKTARLHWFHFSVSFCPGPVIFWPHLLREGMSVLAGDGERQRQAVSSGVNSSHAN